MLSCHMYSFQVLLLWFICFGPVAPNYFLCIIAVVNFCMHHCNLQFLHYSDLVFYTLQQFTAFICTISIGNFCMYYCNSYIWNPLLQHYSNRQHFIHYYNYQLLYVLLQSTIFYVLLYLRSSFYANAIDNCCMLYSNCGIFYVEKTISLSKQLQYPNNNVRCISNLLWTDILTSRAAMAAKYAKYDNRIF